MSNGRSGARTYCTGRTKCSTASASCPSPRRRMQCAAGCCSTTSRACTRRCGTPLLPGTRSGKFTLHRGVWRLPPAQPHRHAFRAFGRRKCPPCAPEAACLPLHAGQAVDADEEGRRAHEGRQRGVRECHVDRQRRRHQRRHRPVPHRLASQPLVLSQLHRRLRRCAPLRNRAPRQQPACAHAR